MAEVLREYIAIYTDHEGGNVSDLCDPYLSMSNAINGLAGPLHGQLNQEALKFLLKLYTAIREKGLGDMSPYEGRVKGFIGEYLDQWL